MEKLSTHDDVVVFMASDHDPGGIEVHSRDLFTRDRIPCGRIGLWYSEVIAILPIPEDEWILKSIIGSVSFSDTLKAVVSLLQDDVTCLEVITSNDYGNLIKCQSIESSVMFSSWYLVCLNDHLVVITGHSFQSRLE